MRLLSLRLDGQYKGLRDQTFDFSYADGNMIAFIGLNGSGKSQLLELIAETFSYLERYLRHDFKSRNWFDELGLELNYLNQAYDSEALTYLYKVIITPPGHVQLSRDGHKVDLENENDLDQILPSEIIGYSSGLNENLQRAFMKNAVQYLDAMNIKRAWEIRLTAIKKNWDEKGKQLTESDLELYGRQISEAYTYYQIRHPSIFPKLQDNINVIESTELGLRATPLPRLKYIDHDTTGLLLTSLGFVKDEDQQAIWIKKQRFSRVHSAVIKYDLRKFTHDAGALLDIAKLVKCIGGIDSNNFSTTSRSKTSEEFFNQFELDYLTGEITVNFSQNGIPEAIADAFFEPAILFEKLYRLQLLGADFWPADMKRNLRQDRFQGSIKKPQKWASPIKIMSLKLTTDFSCIEFDDLSDGEAQLIQVLAMTAIYKNKRSLYLLDEPETHLNPSWRTYFHAYLDEIVNGNITNKKVQLFVSTHSPFMVSSLKRNNVYYFRRNQDNLIEMNAVQNETYGASFDVLIKDLFELRSLISQSVIDEIREQLKYGDVHARNWIEKILGPSAEKAYLIRKLSQ
ncbi:AAA family ATPase [Pseudomonas fragi]|nr:AAA family ATPase [Pseudomonas fragi]